MPVSIPGIENLSPAVKYVIAFAIIFVLLALFALILRRLTGGKMALSNDRGRARQPRLGIVDVYDLDRQRQLILLRRDNVEHLLLVGGPNDVVVETNIVRVPGARLPLPAEAEKAEPAVERQVEIPVTRPSLDTATLRAGDRAFEPTVTAHLGAEPISASATAAPSPPGALRPAPPGLAAQTPRVPEARIAQATSPRDRPGPSPVQTDASRALEAAVGRAVQPTEAPKPTPPRPAPPPPSPPPPPPPAPVVPPRPRPAEPPPSRPAPPPVLVRPEPPKPVPAPPAARPAPPPATPAESAERPAPPPPAPPPPAAKAEPPAPPAASAAVKPDPFSIEDIEAEFARLLGRPLDRKE